MTADKESPTGTPWARPVHTPACRLPHTFGAPAVITDLLSPPGETYPVIAHRRAPFGSSRRRRTLTGRAGRTRNWFRRFKRKHACAAQAAAVRLLTAGRVAAPGGPHEDGERCDSIASLACLTAAALGTSSGDIPGDSLRKRGFAPAKKWVMIGVDER
jgi:hypothetical protein